jgi:hypothetical protein
MTFKNIKLKNLCYLFLIFKEVHSTENGLKSEQVNFVCTHTKILFIITFTKELLFFI